MKRLRVKKYSRNTLLPFEKETFRVVPLDVPYFRRLLKDRLKDYKTAIERHMTVKQWQDMVIQRYIHKGLTDDRTEANAWHLLQEYEREYRLTNSNDPYFIFRKRKSHHSLNVNKKLMEKQRRKLNAKRGYIWKKPMI